MTPKQLTREDVIRTARAFRRSRKLGKWTVVVGEQEYPARQLVLAAANVPPNDSTNSHQAVAVLRALGFKIRYGNTNGDAATDPEQALPGVQVAEMLAALAKEIPKRAWRRVPTDLSKNVDHYLYGARKTRR